MNHNKHDEIDGLTYETLIEELRDLLLDDTAHAVPIYREGELRWAISCRIGRCIAKMDCQDKVDALKLALFYNHRKGASSDVQAVRDLIHKLKEVIDDEHEAI